MCRDEHRQWANVHEDPQFGNLRNHPINNLALERLPYNSTVLHFELGTTVARKNSTFANVNVCAVKNTHDIPKFTTTGAFHLGKKLCAEILVDLRAEEGRM
ncbi:hypothetical protein WICPIJ_006701 [Wickerhamomyces pijperi]|uniref:Uncharacterized protein n=1 Tax=Wickerhamomyces pijperi TaxID=599730 RepID=A0A9P8Q3R9_WICPI|nr:hypothetical protein WICPIJ_006701 [Wickerhamomyces pijperi]